MKMPGEGDADAGKTTENGEAAAPEGEDSTMPFKHKYRELKRRLKCLVYERECFEAEMQKAQSRLLELTTEKSILLDQLMRYEPILLTDDEDELTDYSASEDEAMNRSMDGQFPSKQPTPVPVTHQPVAAVKSTGTPSSVTPSTTAVKPNELTKHGIAKATAILNSVSEATVTKALKAGNKRQSKGKISTGAVTKIAKTLARTRETQPTQRSQATTKQENSISKTSSLVISFPRSFAQLSSSSSSAAAPTTLTTHTLEQRVTVKTLSPLQPAPVKNQGGVQVKAVSQSIPPLLLTPATQEGTVSGRVSTSSSGSSSSSSSSDSEDSGSESSSSSPDEAMETGGPVPITSMAKNADHLPRPKAILSPVKVAPPIALTNTPPPPLISPLDSPGRGAQMTFTWTKTPGADVKTPTPGLTPIAPPLSSPTSTLPFSSLNKPGSTNSAFQIVSPRLHATQPAISSQENTPSLTTTDSNSTV